MTFFKNTTPICRKFGTNIQSHKPSILADRNWLIGSTTGMKYNFRQKSRWRPAAIFETFYRKYLGDGLSCFNQIV